MSDQQPVIIVRTNDNHFHVIHPFVRTNIHKVIRPIVRMDKSTPTCYLSVRPDEYMILDLIMLYNALY